MSNVTKENWCVLLGVEMVSKTQNYLFLILIVKQTKRPFFHDDMNYNIIYLSYHFIKFVYSTLHNTVSIWSSLDCNAICT